MKEENVKEWLRLSESGYVAEADDFYYNTLFRDVIDEFCERNSQPQIRCNVLFSILGYSPEPIILTQRALNPEVHIIFTTDIKNPDASKIIRSYLSMYLTSEFKIIDVHDVSFNGIYNCLKDQMLLHPSQDYVIDITGGKKSMVATAAIFGRDFNCNVVYVDYDQYVSNIRKPLPGSERLNYVYIPSIDLPEIKVLSKLSKMKENSFVDKQKQDKSKPIQNETPKSYINKDTFTKSDFLLTNQELKNAFNSAFMHYTGDETGICRDWLPTGIYMQFKPEKTVIFKSKKLGESVIIQRSHLFEFYIKCKQGVASPRHFLKGTSNRSLVLNPAIYGLIDVINYELTGERFIYEEKSYG
jgi:hypothetical protein